MLTITKAPQPTPSPLAGQPVAAAASAAAKTTRKTTPTPPLQIELNDLPPDTALQVFVTGANGEKSARLVKTDARGTLKLDLHQGDAVHVLNVDGVPLDLSITKAGTAGETIKLHIAHKKVDVGTAKSTTPQSGVVQRWSAKDRSKLALRMPAELTQKGVPAKGAPLRLELNSFPPHEKLLVKVDGQARSVTADASGRIVLDIKAGQRVEVAQTVNHKTLRLVIRNAGVVGLERIKLVYGGKAMVLGEATSTTPQGGAVQRWFGQDKDKANKLAFRMPAEVTASTPTPGTSPAAKPLAVELNDLAPKTAYQVTVPGHDGKPTTQTVTTDAKGTLTLDVKQGQTVHVRSTSGVELDLTITQAGTLDEKVTLLVAGRRIDVGPAKHGSPQSGVVQRWMAADGKKLAFRMPAEVAQKGVAEGSPLRLELNNFPGKVALSGKVDGSPRIFTSDASGRITLDVKAGQDIELEQNVNNKTFRLVITDAGLAGREKIKLVYGGKLMALGKATSAKPLGGTVQRWFGQDAGNTHKLALRMPAEVAGATATPPVSSATNKSPGPAGTYQGYIDAKTGKWVQPELPKGIDHSKVIAVLGDSISDQGFYDAKSPGAQTWASQMAGLQKDRILWVSGRRGVSASGIQTPPGEAEKIKAEGSDANTRLTTLLAQKPGTIVLEFGLNDFRSGATAEQYESAMIAMVDRIRKESPATKIVFMGVKIPTDFVRPKAGTPAFARYLKRYAEFAAAAKQIGAHVTQRAGDVYVADMFKGLTDPQGRLTAPFNIVHDDVHPSGAGNSVIAQTMDAAISGPAPVPVTGTALQLNRYVPAYLRESRDIRALGAGKTLPPTLFTEKDPAARLRNAGTVIALYVAGKLDGKTLGSILQNKNGTLDSIKAVVTHFRDFFGSGNTTRIRNDVFAYATDYQHKHLNDSPLSMAGMLLAASDAAAVQHLAGLTSQADDRAFVKAIRSIIPKDVALKLLAFGRSPDKTLHVVLLIAAGKDDGKNIPTQQLQGVKNFVGELQGFLERSISNPSTRQFTQYVLGLRLGGKVKPQQDAMVEKLLARKDFARVVELSYYNRDRLPITAAVVDAALNLQSPAQLTYRQVVEALEGRAGNTVTFAGKAFERADIVELVKCLAVGALAGGKTDRSVQIAKNYIERVGLMAGRTVTLDDVMAVVKSKGSDFSVQDYVKKFPDGFGYSGALDPANNLAWFLENAGKVVGSFAPGATSIARGLLQKATFTNPDDKAAAASVLANWDLYFPGKDSVTIAEIQVELNQIEGDIKSLAKIYTGTVSETERSLAAVYVNASLLFAGGQSITVDQLKALSNRTAFPKLLRDGLKLLVDNPDYRHYLEIGFKGNFRGKPDNTINKKDLVAFLEDRIKPGDNLPPVSAEDKANAELDKALGVGELVSQINELDDAALRKMVGVSGGPDADWDAIGAIAQQATVPWLKEVPNPGQLIKKKGYPFPIGNKYFRLDLSTYRSNDAGDRKKLAALILVTEHLDTLSRTKGAGEYVEMLWSDLSLRPQVASLLGSPELYELKRRIVSETGSPLASLAEAELAKLTSVETINRAQQALGSYDKAFAYIQTRIAPLLTVVSEAAMVRYSTALNENIAALTRIDNEKALAAMMKQVFADNGKDLSPAQKKLNQLWMEAIKKMGFHLSAAKGGAIAQRLVRLISTSLRAVNSAADIHLGNFVDDMKKIFDGELTGPAVAAADRLAWETFKEKFKGPGQLLGAFKVGLVHVCAGIVGIMATVMSAVDHKRTLKTFGDWMKFVSGVLVMVSGFLVGGTKIVFNKKLFGQIDRELQSVVIRDYLNLSKGTINRFKDLESDYKKAGTIGRYGLNRVEGNLRLLSGCCYAFYAAGAFMNADDKHGIFKTLAKADGAVNVVAAFMPTIEGLAQLGQSGVGWLEVVSPLYAGGWKLFLTGANVVLTVLQIGLMIAPDVVAAVQARRLRKKINHDYHAAFDPLWKQVFLSRAG